MRESREKAKKKRDRREAEILERRTRGAAPEQQQSQDQQKRPAPGPQDDGWIGEGHAHETRAIRAIGSRLEMSRGVQHLTHVM